MVSVAAPPGPLSAEQGDGMTEHQSVDARRLQRAEATIADLLKRVERLEGDAKKRAADERHAAMMMRLP